MKRNRSQAMVCRDGKLLLVEHRMKGRDFFNLPGGGIEENETPEEAALRELNEEAGVSGKLCVRLPLNINRIWKVGFFTFW